MDNPATIASNKDLAERLRKLSAHLVRVGDSVHSPTVDEAAFRIERFDAELADARARASYPPPKLPDRGGASY